MTPVTRSFLVLLSIAAPLRAQQSDSSLLSVQRIYGSPEFKSQSFGPAKWLGDGSSYTTLEEVEDGGQNPVRYDTERSARQVLLVARQFIPQGDSIPLRVEEYAWSPDNKLLLIFTDTQPVWRFNTRGDTGCWISRTDGSPSLGEGMPGLHADVRQILTRRKTGGVRAGE